MNRLNIINRDGEVVDSSTVAITSSTLNSILTALQGALSVTPTT